MQAQITELQSKLSSQVELSMKLTFMNDKMRESCDVAQGSVAKLTRAFETLQADVSKTNLDRDSKEMQLQATISRLTDISAKQSAAVIVRDKVLRAIGKLADTARKRSRMSRAQKLILAAFCAQTAYNHPQSLFYVLQIVGRLLQRGVFIAAPFIKKLMLHLLRVWIKAIKSSTIILNAQRFMQHAVLPAGGLGQITQPALITLNTAMCTATMTDRRKMTGKQAALLFDGGCTTMMTNSKWGLVGEIKEIPQASFATAGGNRNFNHVGRYVRTVYGRNGGAVTIDAQWHYALQLTIYK